ncbi:MAG: flagellar biosynthetic protein FliO [Planctomycetota bacterium]
MGKKILIMMVFCFTLVCNVSYGVTEVVQDEKNYGTVSTETGRLGVESPINFPKVTKYLESIGLILIIVVVALYFLRGKLGIKTGIGKKKRYLSIVDSVPLGSKKYIHLIKIPGKILVVGATHEKIHTLAEITEKEIVDSINTETQGSEFVRFLKRAYHERT